jgi:hypothetical protein
MFIAALFVVPNTWKQLKCPSTAEGINGAIPIQWNKRNFKKNKLDIQYG